MENGGESFNYIPCLNDQPEHISFMADLVGRHIQGWPEANTSRDKSVEHAEYEKTAQLANKLMSADPKLEKQRKRVIAKAAS